ncbi:MAG: cation:proton antiporter, partial [Acidiferrobacterales bacterium]
MDPIWLVIAFILGLAARHVGLPPMIGFLIAGFVLNAAGIEGGELIEEVADLGVTLLLFTIGLKLRVETLLRPQVWAVASGHMILTVLIFGSGIYALAVSGAALFAELDLMLALLIAFALSFSSTVFAVKVLEEKGEMAALHGRIAIGILIMQDIFAVVFLALSTGKIPSLWAIALLALIPLRPLLTGIMARSGHGELLILYGILIAFGGAALFEAVGVKGDLGALIIGALLANHPKASELAKSLLGFKDLFLVGFFLNVGLSAALSFQAFGIAAILVLLVALKMSLFFVLLTRLQARARTSLLASLSLANYSEFGLIVAAIGVANGWITGDWLAIIAIALSVSFVLASPLNVAAHSIYAHYGEPLRRFETASRLPEEQPIKPGAAEVAIFGMG